MLKYKLIALCFGIKMTLCNCHTEINQDGFSNGKKEYEVSEIFRMPKEIDEGSGLVKVQGKNTYLTLNDGGGKSMIYEVNDKGDLLAEIPVKNTENIDWEELSQSPNGDLFIGDFGNNNNDRKDLIIYHFNKGNVKKIPFRYADQMSFPPPKKERNFDCEASLYYKDSLYLFSKNRGDNMVKMYVIAAEGSQHIAQVKDQTFIKTMVTGAAISPDNKQFAILTYGKVFLFEIKENQLNFKYPTLCITFKHKQTEAVCYANNTDLVVSNEQGSVFLLKKKRK
jgi:hypothetical protein